MTEQQAVIDRWTNGVGCTFFQDVPKERLNYMIYALEIQRRLNELVTDSCNNAVFKRISIPIVRRLMEQMPELRSGLHKTVSVHETSLSCKSSLLERYHSAMSGFNLDQEAEFTAKFVEDLKFEIRQFMKSQNKNSMYFLGCTIDDKHIVHFYYNWVIEDITQ